MAGNARIVIDVLVNAQDAASNLDRSASQMTSFGSSMERLAVPAGIAVGAIAGIGWAAAQAASATQQSMGAVESVFGSSAGKVKGWAENSAQAVGLSTSAYGQLAAVAGASMKSMGMSQDEAADSTGKMITLASDLAATMGGTTTEAVEALTSALRGEADPAEALGLNLKQSTVAARMAADGTDTLTGSALDAAKAQTIMQLATEQAGAANGQFARESDSAAGSAQIAAAEYENAKAALGEGLLPVLAAVTTALGGMAHWVGENTALVTGIVAVVGTLALAILAVNAAMAVASAAQTAWTIAQGIGKGITAAATAVQWAFNAAMSANPVMLVVLAVAALVAGIIILWNKSEAFQNFIKGMWAGIQKAAEACWNGIKVAAEWVFNLLKQIVNAYFSFYKGIWDAMWKVAETCWNGVKVAAENVINWIKGAIDGLKAAASGAFNAIKDIGAGIWGFIKNAAQSALDAIMWPINKVKDAINNVVNGIKDAINWAKNLAKNIPVIGGIFKSAPAPAGPTGARYWVPAPAVARAGLGSFATQRSGGSSGPQIVVQGALDPVAVARQIQDLLSRQARRNIGTRIVAVQR